MEVFLSRVNSSSASTPHFHFSTRPCAHIFLPPPGALSSQRAPFPGGGWSSQHLVSSWLGGFSPRRYSPAPLPRQQLGPRRPFSCFVAAPAARRGADQRRAGGDGGPGGPGGEGQGGGPGHRDARDGRRVSSNVPVVVPSTIPGVMMLWLVCSQGNTALQFQGFCK